MFNIYSWCPTVKLPSFYRNRKEKMVSVSGTKGEEFFFTLSKKYNPFLEETCPHIKTIVGGKRKEQQCRRELCWWNHFLITTAHPASSTPKQQDHTVRS